MSEASPAPSGLSTAEALAEVEAHLTALRRALPATNEPLRLAARRLRWFRAAFHAHLAEAERLTGARFSVNDAALAAAFVDWLRAIAVQRPQNRAERDAFFDFSAGLALRELCRHQPLTLVQPPQGAAPDSPLGFWPEGHVLTSFALALLFRAREQEFGAAPRLDPLILDLRSWWSFRENLRRDPSFAAGFLQAVIGQDPNWRLPDVFWARSPGQSAH